jgi:endonuclease G
MQLCFRRILFCLLFFSNTAAFAKVEAVIGNVAIKANINLAGPQPTGNVSEIIISRKEYVISYNKDRRAPNWVAWKVTAQDLGSSGRTNVFAVDPDLESYLAKGGGHYHAVAPEEYKGSCFDRGHQVPSGDRTSDVSSNGMTFVMSNMIPQTAYLNRTIWEHLEAYTRQLVQSGKQVYVIAGPIYDENFGSIGTANDIPVPSKDFKVVIILDANQTPADIGPNTPIIAVVMPNVLHDGSKPTDRTTLCSTGSVAQSTSTDDWKQYKSSITDIEHLSGLSIPY